MTLAHAVQKSLSSLFEARGLHLQICAGFLASVLAGCSERTPPSQRTTFSDSVGVHIAHTRIDASAPVCQLAERTVRIGAVGGDSAYELFNARDAVRLSDGRIAVLNAGTWQIKVFDSAGSAVLQFGRRGQGPGEFRNLWSLDSRGADTLVIGEYRPWRFSFFTVDGNFLRSVEASPPIIERPEVAMVLSSDNGLLIGESCCATQEQGFTDETVIVERYTADGSLVDTIGRFWYAKAGFLSTELRYVGGPIFGARAAFATFPGDTLLYAPGRFEQIEFWTPEGGLGRIIRWDARDRRVRREDVEEWKRQLRDGFRGDLSSPQARARLEAQIGDHRPIADAFPAHDEWDGLLVSREGVIWIKEFRRPLDEGASRWFVFRRAGNSPARP
jgi:hypothetical protein